MFFVNETDTNQTKTDYIESFRALKKEIEANRFKKVILSRTKKVGTQKKALEIFEELNQKYANTFNYIISNSKIGTWIGSTPERLFSLTHKNFETMALAGTKTSNDQWSEKEYEEQKMVTDTISEVLITTNCKNIKTNGPTTITAGQVQHLHTKIEAELENKTDWIKLLNQLHPTAAVCGIPKKQAQKYIPILEKHNRQFYTGFIGLISPEQKKIFVNLRCMELYEKCAKLYLGGGITAPSNEDAEWLETERKALTLEGVLDC